MPEKRLEQIQLEQIIPNRWYLGRGRNDNIGYFNGSVFLTWCYKFELLVEKHEEYYAEKSGCFQPFLLLATLEEFLEKNPNAKQISEKELEEGTWYFGKGKSNYVACWDKDKFITIGIGKTGMRLWKKGGPKIIDPEDGLTAVVERYSKDFKPLKAIDEGVMVEPFEKKPLIPQRYLYGRILVVKVD